MLTNDTDVDAGDTKTVSGVAAGVVGSASTNVGSAVTGTYGSINIAANGSYTYTVDNSNASVQALRTSGNTLQDVFTYTMRDTAGLTSTTQITVTIQGANDAPVGVNDTATALEAGGVANGTAGANPTGNVLTNDTDVDSGDTKTVSGVVAGPSASAVGSVGTGVTGTYGSITINADGSYSYTVDNSNAAVQALRLSSQTLTDTFTYQVVDTGGLTSLVTITVTIQGANDAPTAVNDAATAVEAGGTANGTAGTNPTGNVLTNDTDPDSSGNGETKTVVGVLAGTQASAAGNVASSVTGAYGSINIAADGSYTYTVNNSNAAVQALRTSGNTLTDVFTYTMRDTAGLFSTTQVTVTIQGANDTPIALDAHVAAQAIVVDGVNDYIQMEDGDILNGASELTIDLQFRYDSSKPNDFLAGRFNSSGSQSHGIQISGGRILAYFNNWQDRYLGNTTLVNGQIYNVSITMDAAGTANIYLNGVAETLTEVANGHSGALMSTTGGKTLIGADADGFGTYNQFTGAQIFAYRYWNTAQSQSTIAARIGQTIVGNEVGLLGAWDSRNVAGDRLIDLTGRGLHGILYNGATTLLPITLAENSANGTTVATAVVADLDSGDGRSFSLVSDAGGRFAINSSTGVITVANSSLLDFESTATHSITIRATDTAGATWIRWSPSISPTSTKRRFRFWIRRRLLKQAVLPTVMRARIPPAMFSPMIPMSTRVILAR